MLRILVMAALLSAALCSFGQAKQSSFDGSKVKKLVKYLAEARYSPDTGTVNQAVEALLPYRSDALIYICSYAYDLDRQNLDVVFKDARVVNLSIALQRLISTKPKFLESISETGSENLKVLVVWTAASLSTPDWSLVESFLKDKSERVREIAKSRLALRKSF